MIKANKNPQPSSCKVIAFPGTKPVLANASAQALPPASSPSHKTIEAPSHVSIHGYFKDAGVHTCVSIDVKPGPSAKDGITYQFSVQESRVVDGAYIPVPYELTSDPLCPTFQLCHLTDSDGDISLTSFFEMTAGALLAVSLREGENNFLKQAAYDRAATLLMHEQELIQKRTGTSHVNIRWKNLAL